MQCAYFTVSMRGGYQRVTGEALVNHQNVHLGPVRALGNSLHRRNLQQLIRPAPPVLGLDDPVLMQTVLVGHFRSLVDQRCAVTQEHRALAFLHRLTADPQAQIGLASPGGGHDHLVFVSLTKPSSKGVVGVDLKLAGCWKSIITLTWR